MENGNPSFSKFSPFLNGLLKKPFHLTVLICSDSLSCTILDNMLVPVTVPPSLPQPPNFPLCNLPSPLLSSKRLSSPPLSPSSIICSPPHILHLFSSLLSNLISPPTAPASFIAPLNTLPVSCFPSSHSSIPTSFHLLASRPFLLAPRPLLLAPRPLLLAFRPLHPPSTLCSHVGPSSRLISRPHVRLR